MVEVSATGEYITKFETPLDPILSIGHNWVLWELYQSEEGVG